MLSFSQMGIAVSDILLPHNLDTYTWAAIACDQHTSDRKYWDEAEKIVADKPSTLRLMLPEVYLQDAAKDARILSIRDAQKQYIQNNIFDSKHGFVYVERKVLGRLRRGLVVSIDLERYDWHSEARALIRATEATIPERIPPRVAIRRDASLDMPHVMLLVNDRDGLFVEGVGKCIHENNTSPLYDGDLMLGGGHITGYLVDKAGEDAALTALNALYDKSKMQDGSVFLFAVGDGNHSLATARAVWDEVKASLPHDKWDMCPARYALVEIVNLYDEGLVFEPIHRVLFGVDAVDFLAFVVANLNNTINEASTSEEMMQEVRRGGCFGVAIAGRYAVLSLPDDNILPVAHVQDLIDDYLHSHVNGRADYIHGDDEAVRLGQGKDDVGILLPPFSKAGMFQTVSRLGSLPRKSFSMGQSCEKRYYMECRVLK